MSPSRAGAPLVSLGVPVHNAERYLPETLDSLRSQDHEHLEIVISDNGSTDSTPRICRAAAAEDDRIRYLRQPENRGGAWNFRHVAQQSRGEYFKYAAADDVLLPSFVSACVAALQRAGPDCVLAFPRTRLIDDESTPFEDLHDECLHVDQPSAHARMRTLLRAQASHIVYGLMRSDVLRTTRGIRPVVGDDIVLLIELAARGTFALVPEQLFLQRRHDDQYSARGADQVQWHAPGGNPRLAFPQTKLDVECLRAVWSSPLPAAEKARCVAAVTRSWVVPRWRGVAGDVRLAITGR